jgi:trimeric autotransporter adhesin
MKNIFIISVILFSIPLFAQNVGVGTNSPAEKLDVNGNINVTGTIKANGVDGAANQVLMKNSSGVLSWGNTCEYKNYTIFEYTTQGAIQTFTVPAGITKIKAQVWGGGGTGYGIGGAVNMGAGGGGGGFIEGYITVTPASAVSIVVGNGADPFLTNASGSQVAYNSIFLVGYGGGNASYNGTFNRINPGVGGNYFANATTNYIGIIGGAGQPATLRYDQVAATEFGRAITGGNGGNAGNTDNTGGKGGSSFFNITTSTFLSQVLGSNGLVPGGGASSEALGNAGGNGRVIIYY